MEPLLEELRLLIKARYPLISLISYEEERVVRGLRRLAGSEERLAIWSLTRGLESPTGRILESRDPLEALDAVAAHEGRYIFVFKDFHPYFNEPPVLRRLRDLEIRLEEEQKTLIFLSPTLSLPRELEKDIVVLDVPLPTAPEIARLLSALVRGQQLQLTPELFERLVRTSAGLTEKELKRAFTRILAAGHGFTERDLALLHAEKRKALHRSRFLEPIDPGEGLESLGGMGQLKEWMLARGQAFSEKARQFGLPQPKGLFLLGVQGCGKSLTARAVAKIWQLPLLRLDLAGLMNGGQGMEQNLRDTIRVAESMAPVVLWIDEIEKAFGGVGGSEGERGAAYRTFGALLTWLQEKDKPVFVVATANDIQSLPPELLRKGRFDEIFFVDLPGLQERLEILSIHLKSRGRNPEQFELLEVAEATERFSGAELEQLVVSGLFGAFSRTRELTTEELLRQARETVPLAVTMDERIKALKEWARHRTRPAAHDTRRIDFFEEWEELE